MTAILIGFGYNDLNGCVYDLYHAYQFVKNLYKVTIITDLQEIKHEHHQLAHDVDASFYSLLDQNVFKVKNAQELSERLKKIEISKTLFLYFTGHGTLKGIQCPNKTIYPYEELRTFIEVPLSFVVLDCCYGSSLSLPYFYSRQGPKLYKTDKGLVPFKASLNSIYLLTASREDEKANSEDKGSFFSQGLFSYMSLGIKKNKQVEIGKMLAELNYQAVRYGSERYAGYCSFPTLGSLPFSFFSQKEIRKRGPFYILDK